MHLDFSYKKDLTRFYSDITNMISVIAILPIISKIIENTYVI